MHRFKIIDGYSTDLVALTIDKAKGDDAGVYSCRRRVKDCAVGKTTYTNVTLVYKGELVKLFFTFPSFVVRPFFLCFSSVHGLFSVRSLSVFRPFSVNCTSFFLLASNFRSHEEKIRR